MTKSQIPIKSIRIHLGQAFATLLAGFSGESGGLHFLMEVVLIHYFS